MHFGLFEVQVAATRIVCCPSCVCFFPVRGGSGCDWLQEGQTVDQDLLATVDCFLDEAARVELKRRLEAIFYYMLPSHQSLEIIKAIEARPELRDLALGTKHFLLTIRLACLDQVALRCTAVFSDSMKELSLLQVLAFVRSSCPTARKTQLDELLAPIRELVPLRKSLDRFRTVRSKFVAHIDLERALEPVTNEERLNLEELCDLQERAEKMIWRLGYGASGDMSPPEKLDGDLDDVLALLVKKFRRESGGV